MGILCAAPWIASLARRANQFGGMERLGLQNMLFDRAHQLPDECVALARGSRKSTTLQAVAVSGMSATAARGWEAPHVSEQGNRFSPALIDALPTVGR